jgi:hypothetical protein
MVASNRVGWEAQREGITVKHTEGAKVRFMASTHTPATGTITRVWAKPQRDPYVTIKADDGRQFVRCSSEVTETREA